MIASNKRFTVSCFWERCSTLFLAMSLFSVPLSSTAKSICIPLALISILMTPRYQKRLRYLIRQPWCKATLLVFFMVLLGCIWSSATLKEKGFVLEKYSKLLYLPILVAGFSKAHVRWLGMYAFLAAIVVTSVVSLLQHMGWLFLSHPVEFRNYIMIGHMTAFAAYLSAYFCIHSVGKARLLYAILAILFSYHVLFISIGRTGYVIYFVLMLLLVAQTYSWRKAILINLIMSSLFVVGYYQNPVMQSGVERIQHDWKKYNRSDKNTSLGYRLQFHQYAKQLFLRHPWIGNGTASFTHQFEIEAPVPSWQHKLLEPHSLYWLIAAELGIVGLITLFFFFVSLLLASLDLKTMRAPAIALFVPFVIGNGSDSLLFYSGSGYFFILWMALCLGEQQKQAR